MCKVAKTRWPVSARVSVIAIDSISRISPSKITSGSSRRADRNPSSKVLTSVPTSRWLISDRLCVCTNSTGSSIVKMWQARSRLIWSIMAANVVLLPEPVGPTTKTNPYGAFSNFEQAAGAPSSSSGLMRWGTTRRASAMHPRWRKVLARNRPTPLIPNEKST